MKVKVCGTRQPSNIQALAALDVDMLGFIFYKKSSRYIGDTAPMDLSTIEQDKVGVFVNEPMPTLLELVGKFSLDYVQLHGDESPAYCQNLKSVWPSVKLIKAFSVDEAFDFASTQAYELYCDYFIFDTKGTQRGGNGITFDWKLLHSYQGMTPFLLSGGISAEMATAIRSLAIPQLAGVDINSCFEEEAGLKDVALVQSFVKELKSI